MNEERTVATGAKRLAVGAAAVAMLAVFGGVAYAQQGGNPQDPAQQAPSAQQQERNGGGPECPWGQQGGEGQPQQTEV